MAIGSTLRLEVLDAVSVKELDLASELFHRINRVIPRDQKLLTVPPDCLVRDAIAQMNQYGYSQLPVLHNNEVLGVFSFRSFATDAARMSLSEVNSQRCAPGDLPVDDFLERFEFARVTDEMNRVFDAMDRDNGVLIGAPENLIGVLAPMDFLRYLYRVAGPFVSISEIELALRALIRVVLSEAGIETTSKRLLTSAYGDVDKAPATLEEMTFDNYRTLITHTDSWSIFENIMGGNRARVGGKLKEVGEIRNALFHFKREIADRDHQTLAAHRNWLLTKVKQANGRDSAEARS